MSIYGSELFLGRETFDSDGPPPETWPRHYEGSHLYPTTDDRHAFIDTASIPHWCIPGHDGEGPGAECSACDAHVDGYAAGVAPWLRLTIGSGAGNYTVAVPVAGAERLRDWLTDWLDRVAEVQP